MKRIVSFLIVLVYIISSVCFIEMASAITESSIKIDSVTYKSKKDSSSTCVVSSGGQGLPILYLAFDSIKMMGKSASINLYFYLTSDEFEELKSKSILSFEHGDVSSIIAKVPKVVLLFSEKSENKSREKVLLTSKGPSNIGMDNNYFVSGTVNIINKRSDGCLDISLNAIVNNSPIGKTIITLDPQKNCIKNTHIKNLNPASITNISGNLFSEKIVPIEGETSSTTEAIPFCKKVSSSGGSIPVFTSPNNF